MLACLDAIGKLTETDKNVPFREQLLSLVILRVEGEKVTKFLIEERLQKASTPEERENFQRAIALLDEVKGW